MAEFGPKSMFSAIGSIYGTAFGPQERERALVTVLRVWPGAVISPHMMSETGRNGDAAANGDGEGETESNEASATNGEGVDT